MLCSGGPSVERACPALRRTPGAAGVAPEAPVVPPRRRLARL